jgi:hypothetical protein
VVDIGEVWHPDWVDPLLAEVNLAFESTGADTPSWPNPHPGRSPLEDEYSRVTNAGKYRILDTRVDAWARTLSHAGLAETREVPAASWISAPRPSTALFRVRQVEPTRPGGLALLFATTLVDGEPFGLDVGITRDAERPVYVESVPFCGCDACDAGSAELLEILDQWVLTVARGGVVHARLGEHHVTRAFNGWSSSGSAHPSWLDESLVPPDGVRRWVGVPWR